MMRRKLRGAVCLLDVLRGAPVDALLLALQPGAPGLGLTHGVHDLLAALRGVLPSGLCLPVLADMPALGAIRVVPVRVPVVLGDAHPPHDGLLRLGNFDADISLSVAWW